MQGLIAILAKQPTPGLVKTRLAKSVGPERAAAFAEAFLLDTIDVALAVPDADVLLSFDPPDSEAWFRAHVPQDCALAPQPTGGLGPRIHGVFQWAASRGARTCVAMGMDTPQMDPSRISEALAASEDGAVAVGPSVDGGYYIIGMDRPRPTLFEGVAWSTEDVLRQTKERIEAAGAPLRLLPEERDVDTLDDLLALDPSRLGARSLKALTDFVGSRKG